LCADTTTFQKSFFNKITSDVKLYTAFFRILVPAIYITPQTWNK